MRLLLVNPNTDPATTRAMVAVARDSAPPAVAVEGATAEFGVPLITDEGALAVAAEAVAALMDALPLEAFDGVIVSAFGDPGLDAVRARLVVPVTGIAEAGMAEAASSGRFVVVTTTPALAASIARAASAYGHGDRFGGVRLTEGDPRRIMADETRLVAALEAACRSAVHEDAAAAIVIGGGPLAVAARALRPRIPVPIVEPVPAAVRLAVARALAGPGPSGR